jgi:hypothetical protein
MYETFSTPLNTEELSLATSLPRRDVPGLRFVRNAVRFATNPPRLKEGSDVATLGRVMDTGVALDMMYTFDFNSLVRHALVTGVSGSGKSTTCRILIEKVISRKIPVLIIEPAKDEYVRWAINYNKQADEENQISIFMPGVGEFEGVPLQELKLNPFEPASAGDGTLDFATRCERFCALLTASLPMEDILPTLLEESIYQYLENNLGGDFVARELPARQTYPRLEGLTEVARQIIKSRSYEPKIQDTLIAALQTRIRSLSRGKRGIILNVEKSTPFFDLFERPAVVNLSQIADDRDKSLVMALLLMAMFEYRTSKFRLDPEYQQLANSNKLCHLAVVEEAHRLLKAPERDIAGIGSPQAVVATMFSDMLSEIRAYGQGLLIVDQLPSRLISDAIKNTNYKIAHRLVARDDRAAMSACMALRPDQEDIIAVLPIGEAIVCSDHDDAASWVKVGL